MKLRETIMKLVFLIAACCSVLAVALICIFLFMNGVPAIFKIGSAEIFDRYRVETGKQHFRYPADDCRQYLRDRPCNPDGCAGCHSYFGVSFPLLSEKVLRHLQIRY